MTIEAGKLLILNLALWYLPALLMPAIVWARAPVPARHRPRARAIAVHVAGALLFSCVHFVGMLGVRFLLWPTAASRRRRRGRPYFQRAASSNSTGA